MKSFSIHSSDSCVYLHRKKYHMDIIGGWGIRENGFTMKLTHFESGETVFPQRTKSPVRSFQAGQRAKRHFDVDIPKEGMYSIVFIKPETLQVKRTNLLFFGLFSNSIANEEIYVCFTSEYGQWT